MKMEINQKDQSTEIGSKLFIDLEGDANTVLDMRNTWHNKDPTTWVSSDILNWIYFNAGLNGIPLGSLKGEKFQGLTGLELCSMTSEDFRARDPDYGEFLHFTLKVQLSNAEKRTGNKDVTSFEKFLKWSQQKQRPQIQQQKSDYPEPSFQISTPRLCGPSIPQAANKFLLNQQKLQQYTNQQQHIQQNQQLQNSQQLQKEFNDNNKFLLLMKQRLLQQQNQLDNQSQKNQVQLPMKILSSLSPFLHLNAMPPNLIPVSNINNILPENTLKSIIQQQQFTHKNLPQQKLTQQHLIKQQLLQQQKLLFSQTKDAVMNKTNFKGSSETFNSSSISFQLNSTNDLNNFNLQNYFLNHRLLMPSTINININSIPSSSKTEFEIKTNDRTQTTESLTSLNLSQKSISSTLPNENKKFQEKKPALIPVFVQNFTDDDDETETVSHKNKKHDENGGICNNKSNEMADRKSSLPIIVENYNSAVDQDNRQQGKNLFDSPTSFNENLDHNNNITNSSKSNNSSPQTSTSGLSYYKIRKMKLQMAGPTISSCNSPKKRSNKILLSDFMRDLLDDPRYNPSYVCWEDQPNRIFRIVSGKSKEVAILWGKRKNNPKMNFEKMGRSLRWCRANNGNFSEVPKSDKLPKKLIFRLSK